MYGSGCHILGDSFVKIAVAFLKKKEGFVQKTALYGKIFT